MDGSGFHLYGGKMDAMSEVHNAHPTKNLYFTDQMVTGSVEGKPTVNVGTPVQRLIIGQTQFRLVTEFWGKEISVIRPPRCN